MAQTPVPVQPRIMSVSDLEEAASKKLPRIIRNFYNDGATDMVTVKENSTAYLKYRIRPRVLTNVSGWDPSVECLGRQCSFPLGISPAGIQAMAHPDGELATSRACAERGINMIISTFANYSTEEICAAGRNNSPAMTHAIQLYPFKDKGLELKIIREAEAHGCKAIFLTADSPRLGVRYREWKDDFRTPAHLGFPNLGWTADWIQKQSHDDSVFTLLDEAQDWTKEIPWLRSVTKMQIWVKGVLTAEDTLQAVQHGCDGILVSNHGGRQLDGVPATIDALPECVEAAAGRLKIHIDGGIRSGSDMFKALAMGAEYCWIGRPMLWALAYDGEKGVKLLLDNLWEDFRRCMELAGCRTIKDITKASLGVYRSDGPLARL